MAVSTKVTLSNLPSSVPSSIQFPGPKFTPQGGELFPMFMGDTTAGNVFYSWQVADKVSTDWPLILRSLTTEEYTTLLELYVRHLRGSSVPFDYTHTDGNTYRGVRWVDTTFKFSRISPNEYDVNFTLRVEDVAIGDPSFAP